MARGDELRQHLVVVGLGYVGLPLVMGAVHAGYKVTGLDISADTVNSLNAGLSHVDDLSDDDVKALIHLGFIATSDPNTLTDANIILICVPTPLSPDGGPDLAAVKAAAKTVAHYLQLNQLVVLESTTYPGTTDEVIVPILETSGFKVGSDFFCAYSPERIDPGNTNFGLRNTPKVIGGVTSECTIRAHSFYAEIVNTVIVAKGTREAEMTKLLENTYRHINIALVNEMAKFSHELGVDLWDSIRCASTKPFGFEAFYPGPGVGGHCIPIDPNYLSHRVKTQLGQSFKFVELAQEVNASMPAYVVRRAQDLLNQAGLAVQGADILLLGVTYKADISDQRESPAVDVARGLRALGANIAFHDPYVSKWSALGEDLTSIENLLPALTNSDLVVILQAHSVYMNLEILPKARRILDTRGAFSGPNVTRL